jgi:hypothetical protein
MEQQFIEGKKVFLLYPHSVIQDEMLDTLIMNGYEVYVLRDHKRARLLLEKFSMSIMFINIDEKLPEKEWEAYIREIISNPKTKSVRLGILSYNNDRDLMEKYLMDIAIPCGFIQLKLGVKESTRIIRNALLANEARGRRKCFRAICEDEPATLNYKEGSRIYYGKLLDISAAGFAARIENFEGFQSNSLLKDFQLNLHGSLVTTDVILIGNRFDNKNIWIMLFGPNITPNHQFIIYRFIKQCLQHFIDSLSV